MTRELIYLLEEYRKGRRPERITSGDPTFFDPRSSEPNIWYFRDRDGAIDIFDLMGTHPETGEELQPLTRDIVDLWKDQNKRREAEKLRHPARQIDDPERFGFFDALTGKPRVWYWRRSNGEYEFYDNSGYHPLTGEQLAVITKDVITAWKAAVETAEKKELEKREREERDQKAAEEREQKRVGKRHATVKLLQDVIHWQPTRPTRTDLPMYLACDTKMLSHRQKRQSKPAHLQ